MCVREGEERILNWAVREGLAAVSFQLRPEGGKEESLVCWRNSGWGGMRSLERSRN